MTSYGIRWVIATLSAFFDKYLIKNKKTFKIKDLFRLRISRVAFYNMGTGRQKEQE